MAYKQSLENLWLQAKDEFHDKMSIMKMVKRSIRDMRDDRGFARTEQEIHAWQQELDEEIAYKDELETETGNLHHYLCELEDQMRNMEFRLELVTFRHIQ